MARAKLFKENSLNQNSLIMDSNTLDAEEKARTIVPDFIGHETDCGINPVLKDQ